MVYALVLVADVFLGVGWVLQQRVAAQTQQIDDSPIRALRRLIRTPVWWGGIAAMATGQTLAAWGLQSGSLTLVEPLLVGCLLVAFGYAAWRRRERISAGEVLGSLVMIGGVTLFITAAAPRSDVRNVPNLTAVLAATGAVAVAAVIIVLAGRLASLRMHVAWKSAALAAAAGVFYALQDAGTRGAIEVVQGRNFAILLVTGWPYVLLGAATAGVLVSQAAFRAARLDWSLPPTVAMQAMIGVALGVGLLGDVLRITPGALAIEAVSLPLTLLGVIIVGRSQAMRLAHRPTGRRVAERPPERV